MLISGPVPTWCPHTVLQGGTVSSSCFLSVRNGSCCTSLLALSPCQHYNRNDSGHKSGTVEEKCTVYEDSTGMAASALGSHSYKSLPTCNCDEVQLAGGSWSLRLKHVVMLRTLSKLCFCNLMLLFSQQMCYRPWI